MARTPLMAARKAGARSRSTRRRTGFSGHASLGLAAAGAVLFFATLVDLGILWIGQSQGGLQWEFVAATRTIEAFPRLVLGIGLAYGALYVASSSSLFLYRTLGVLLILLGLAGGVLGAILGADYLAMQGNVNPEARSTLMSSVVKSGSLSLLYVILLIPTGVLGLRAGR